MVVEAAKGVSDSSPSVDRPQGCGFAMEGPQASKAVCRLRTDFAESQAQRPGVFSMAAKESNGGGGGIESRDAKYFLKAEQGRPGCSTGSVWDISQVGRSDW